MDSIHDLGGRQGFGPVVPERDEPAFHERWEAIVFATVPVARQAGAVRNVDQFRHAIERIDPRAYLDHGYYGRWLGGLETLLVEAGVLSTQEIDAAALERGARAGDLVAARPNPTPDAVPYLPARVEAQRPVADAPRFAVGDRVRARSHGVDGHTRLPGYARGRVGTVSAAHGGWVFPDSNAHGQGEAPVHLYTVTFSGLELWGDGAEPGTTVAVDLFEPYLEPGDD